MHPSSNPATPSVRQRRAPAEARDRLQSRKLQLTRRTTLRRGNKKISDNDDGFAHGRVSYRS
jgi:hypothetical protein